MDCRESASSNQNSRGMGENPGFSGTDPQRRNSEDFYEIQGVISEDSEPESAAS
jgi:hypothetical protein